MSFCTDKKVITINTCIAVVAFSHISISSTFVIALKSKWFRYHMIYVHNLYDLGTHDR